jgi:hypothetical protein
VSDAIAEVLPPDTTNRMGTVLQDRWGLRWLRGCADVRHQPAHHHVERHRVGRWHPRAVELHALGRLERRGVAVKPTQEVRAVRRRHVF